MRARSVHAHLHRHNFYVEKFTVDKQILIRERWRPNDVGDVAGKDTLVSLKLLHTSLMVNFTTEHVILARRLHQAINALEYRQAVSVTNIVNGCNFHVKMLAGKGEIEKFIIRQPPMGEKDDYDSENSWISDGLPSIIKAAARSFEMKAHTASRSKECHPGTDASARTSRIVE